MAAAMQPGGSEVADSQHKLKIHLRNFELRRFKGDAKVQLIVSDGLGTSTEGGCDSGWIAGTSTTCPSPRRINAQERSTVPISPVSIPHLSTLHSTVMSSCNYLKQGFIIYSFRHDGLLLKIFKVFTTPSMKLRKFCGV